MNSTFPRVSIITPSYNQVPYLEQALRSVLTQDYPNLEYLVLDGGSTDGSLEILQKYASKLAYWVSAPDGGQSAAINHGLERASGEIWAWMNADDAYLPGAVSRAVAWLEAHPAVEILSGDCQVIDAYGQVLGTQPAAQFDARALQLGLGVIPSGSTFLRRRVFEKLGGLDESLHYVMDLDYWLRALGRCTFDTLSETFSLYRVHQTAKTQALARSAVRARELIFVYERFWRENPAAQLQFRTRSLANAYLHAADLAARRGERAVGWSYLRKSLHFGPAILQPRIVRTLLTLFFGKHPAWPTGRP